MVIKIAIGITIKPETTAAGFLKYNYRNFDVQILIR